MDTDHLACFPERVLVLSRGVTPYMTGLYGEVPPDRATFFRLQVYERVGILLVEVYQKGYGNLSFLSVKKVPDG